MKIKIEAAEYFEELLLMEQQYGQEEELYPFIYMFLRNGKNLNDCSIRMVAKMTKADAIPGRKLISANISFPDLAILDKKFELTKLKDREKIDEGKVLNTLIKDFNSNYTHIYGCVEAKKTKDKNFIKLKEGDMQRIEEIDTEYLLVLKPKTGSPNYNYTCTLNDCNEFEYDEDSIKLKIPYGKWTENKTGRINNIPEIREVINRPKRVVEILDRKYITVGNERYELDAVNQLFGELFWYGKLIYTNGLIWYYLEIKKCKNIENQDKAILFFRNEIFEKCIKKQSVIWHEVIANKEVYISCEVIANLTDGYTAYKDNKKLTFEHINQWDNLINGLADRNWLPQSEQTKKD